MDMGVCWDRAQVRLRLWESEDGLWELVLSFHHVSLPRIKLGFSDFEAITFTD